MRAAAAVAAGKEYLVRRSAIVVHRGVRPGRPARPQLRRDFIATLTGQDQACRRLRGRSRTAPSAELYDQTVAGPTLRKSPTYQG